MNFSLQNQKLIFDPIMMIFGRPVCSLIGRLFSLRESGNLAKIQEKDLNQQIVDYDMKIKELNVREAME